MKVFDAHFHIINPNFPLVANHGYTPTKFTVRDYLEKTKEVKVAGGALVSGSFQAFDQQYLFDALTKLGDRFYGVANIPIDMSDFELQKLNKARVKAVRFNLKRGGSERIKHLEYFSKKLYHEFNWHTELYLDGNDLESLMPILKKLPAYSIDHLGISKSALRHLYQCVADGARVKASGFGRIDFNPIPVMRKVDEINPEALLFGTDLPSTRAKVPFSYDDMDLIREQFSEKAQERIFYSNAFQWYAKSS